ncbi:hypothetical protein PTTG_27192 [Puccinia triticina 1-1 BBBD Race 1]|uniref:Uncharacterized protein n=1 Tax=Puccinia triticina (isolate 1-1 / race 1 (BBBD)) TaxID=630390 RepID=A0A180GMQ7_PUCT1|nr:hypothetical protein PTTG_27192 [Puccinia triticina 1-1 BBBD Race 1]
MRKNFFLLSTWLAFLVVKNECGWLNWAPQNPGGAHVSEFEAYYQGLDMSHLALDQDDRIYGPRHFQDPELTHLPLQEVVLGAAEHRKPKMSLDFSARYPHLMREENPAGTSHKGAIAGPSDEEGWTNFYNPAGTSHNGAIAGPSDEKGWTNFENPAGTSHNGAIAGPSHEEGWTNFHNPAVTSHNRDLASLNKSFWMITESGDIRRLDGLHPDELRISRVGSNRLSTAQKESPPVDLSLSYNGDWKASGGERYITMVNQSADSVTYILQITLDRRSQLSLPRTLGPRKGENIRANVFHRLKVGNSRLLKLRAWSGAQHGLMDQEHRYVYGGTIDYFDVSS